MKKNDKKYFLRKSGQTFLLCQIVSLADTGYYSFEIKISLQNIRVYRVGLLYSQSILCNNMVVQKLFFLDFEKKVPFFPFSLRFLCKFRGISTLILLLAEQSKGKRLSCLCDTCGLTQTVKVRQMRRNLVNEGIT